MSSRILENEADRLRVEAHEIRDHAEAAHHGGAIVRWDALMLAAAAKYERIGLRGFVAPGRRWAKAGE